MPPGTNEWALFFVYEFQHKSKSSLLGLKYGRHMLQTEPPPLWYVRVVQSIGASIVHFVIKAPKLVQVKWSLACVEYRVTKYPLSIQDRQKSKMAATNSVFLHLRLIIFRKWYDSRNKKLYCNLLNLEKKFRSIEQFLSELRSFERCM